MFSYKADLIHTFYLERIAPLQHSEKGWQQKSQNWGLSPEFLNVAWAVSNLLCFPINYLQNSIAKSIINNPLLKGYSILNQSTKAITILKIKRVQGRTGQLIKISVLHLT